MIVIESISDGHAHLERKKKKKFYEIFLDASVLVFPTVADLISLSLLSATVTVR